MPTFTNKHGVEITRKPRGPEVIVIDGKICTARKGGDPGYVDLLRHLFTYDPETGQITRRVKINRSAEAGTLVGVPTLGYLRATVLRQSYGCHLIAWAIHYGEWPDSPLDHIDGNRSDNRIANLRKASKGQNSHNSRIPSSNSSGVKGVSWSKISRKWQGYVSHQGKRHHVGFFDSLEDADLAVRKARELLHGEYACHG